ncbi:hypothetical protein CP02DC14_1911B, partial [Chlamydia psittaci 02DC14]
KLYDLSSLLITR